MRHQREPYSLKVPCAFAEEVNGIKPEQTKPVRTNGERGGKRMRKTDGTWRASERGRHVRGLKVTEGLLFTILWGGEHGDTVNTSLAQRAGLRPNWAAIQPLPCRQTESRNSHTHRQTQTYINYTHVTYTEVKDLAMLTTSLQLTSQIIMFIMYTPNICVLKSLNAQKDERGTN